MSVQTSRIEAEAARQEVESDEDAIERLADLPPLVYDRRRDFEAARLGVRPATLDAEVRRVRGEREGSLGLGRAAAIRDPEPWGHTVNGAELLDELTKTLHRYIILPKGAAEAVALWIMHAHAHDTAAISPVLCITSPTPECGKSTLLSLLAALTPRVVTASNITTAAVFRAVEKWRPTLLIDEADTFIRDNDDLRGVLNSGHNRANASVIRTVGESHEPREFTTWAPKAIALIGKLPATLASRAIHVELRRIGDGETVERLREDRLDRFEFLKRKAWRWTQDNAATLQEADPEMPYALRGRVADNWRHLFAIAQSAGGHWPEKAANAAQVMNVGHVEQAANIMLLNDIRSIFVSQGSDRISSQSLADLLGEMEDRPWPEWGRSQKPITPAQIAKMLEPFKVKPERMRLAGHSAGTRGYAMSAFRDAFDRYLPCESATPPQRKQDKGLGHLEGATDNFGVADRESAKAPFDKACGAVADTTPVPSDSGQLSGGTMETAEI